MSESEELSGQKMDACDICAGALAHSPRYPNRLCSGCVDQAVDDSGRGVEFFNEGAFGGVAARFKDTGEMAPKDPKKPGWEIDCWVHGAACSAREARFGGVVVSLKRAAI